METGDEHQHLRHQRGVKMPSFFGYMLWSAVVLLPVFVVLTFVYLARAA
jgi:Na+/H+ antiporter NhaD/arsenite permease-like protein